MLAVWAGVAILQEGRGFLYVTPVRAMNLTCLLPKVMLVTVWLRKRHLSAAA